MRLLPVTAMAWLAFTATRLDGQQIAVGLEHELADGHQLARVSAAVFGPEGLIAVAQPSDSRIFLFDLTRPDRAIATLGREGAGPGEFAQLASIGWMGDTLWATDGTRARVECFLLDGQRLPSRMHDPALPTRKFARYIGPVMILRGGAAVFAPAVAVDTNGIPPASRDELLPVLMAHLGSTRTISVAHLQLFRSIVSLDGDRGSAVMAQPFAGVDLVRSGSDGSRLIVVEQTASATNGSSAWVRGMNALGGELFRRELDIPRVQMSNAIWDSVLTAWSNGRIGRELWTSKAQARRDMQVVVARPKYLPVVASLIVARDGRVWLRHSRDKAGKATWTVLSATGEKVGTVELSGALRVLDATSSEILAARTDEEGFDHLVLIPIVS